MSKCEDVHVVASNSLSYLPTKDAGPPVNSVDLSNDRVDKKQQLLHCSGTYIETLVGGEIDEVVEDERSPPLLVDRAASL